MISICLVICSLSIGFVNGANILAVFPGPLKSQVKGFTPFFIELANKGHNVTVYSAFPPENIPPNYHQVTVENIVHKIASVDVDHTILKWYQILHLLDWPFGLWLTENTLQLPEIQHLINSTNSQFDLIILHSYLQDAYHCLGHKFNAPVIQLAPAAPPPEISFINGNPVSCAYITDIRSKLPIDMNMWERFLNCMFVLFDLLGHHWYYLPKQLEFANKYITYDGSETRPPLRNLLANVSLTLIHSDQVLFQSRPYVPSFIEVSGFHITDLKGLPQDLKKIMDDSKEGVIYFSLGSWINPSYFSAEKQKAIIETLSRLPQTVLWKGDEATNLSKNIVVQKWFPQVDILAHPNTKLFITHGGIHSLMETVHFGVPILGIPLMFDQDTNVKSAVHKGYGRLVNRKTFTADSLYADISELLNNSMYREKALELSATIRDRPLSPMDTAIYWTEYVIKHKGTPHLQSPAKHLHWYQLYLVDFVITIILLLCFVYFFIRLIFIVTIKMLKCIKNKLAE